MGECEECNRQDRTQSCAINQIGLLFSAKVKDVYKGVVHVCSNGFSDKCQGYLVHGISNKLKC